MSEYISSKDTAKLIRKALKREFPGQRFYSQCSRGTGSSISVSWMDGPTEKQVKTVISPYGNGGFDGMIDMAYSYTSWLMPDGTATIAGTSGTGGSRGSVPAFENPKPHPDARRVRFLLNFVFTSRFFTRPVVERAAAEVTAETGWEPPEIRDTDAYLSRTKTAPAAEFVWSFGKELENHTFSKRLAEISTYVKPEKASPTPTQANTENPDASYTVEHDRNWTWIRFDSKPVETIRNVLKELGGRWSRKRGAWYIRERIEPDVIYAALIG